MAVAKPKRFIAARDFTYGRRTWRKGDKIEHGITLQQLLRFGDQFATVKTSTPVEPPADPDSGEATESVRKG